MYYTRHPYARIGQLPPGAVTRFPGALALPGQALPPIRLQSSAEVFAQINALMLNPSVPVPLGQPSYRDRLSALIHLFNEASRREHLNQGSDPEERLFREGGVIWFGQGGPAFRPGLGGPSTTPGLAIAPILTVAAGGGIEPVAFALEDSARSSFGFNPTPTVFGIGLLNDAMPVVLYPRRQFSQPAGAPPPPPR